MNKLLMVIAATALLAACGQSGEFAGIWVGQDYQCPGSGTAITERVRITQEGDYLYVRKLEGDPCVPEGHVSFHGPLQGEMLCLGGYPDSPASGHWKSTMEQISADQFKVCNVTFVRAQGG